MHVAYSNNQSIDQNVASSNVSFSERIYSGFKHLSLQLTKSFRWDSQARKSDDFIGFSGTKTQYIIKNYLTYFKNRLNGQSGLVLFPFKSGRPLAIQCVTPSEHRTEWTLGRQSDNYLFVDDPSLTEIRVKITFVADKWLLANDIDVERMCVNPHGDSVCQLTNGMVIDIGDLVFYLAILNKSTDLTSFE